VHERFRNLKPWVALLYIEQKYRRLGGGKLLLEEIERQAREIKQNEIYSYTFTAESLFVKCGWNEVDRVKYKGYDTVILKKEIKTP
jgi:N-acetylglutamate synthase-like GNAT family acetyltransferase